MRFFEFAGDELLPRIVAALRNYIGRAESKEARAKLNWAGLNQVFKTNKVELATDYGTFKAIYDSNPALQAMVKDFNQDGIELNVPGAPEEEPKGDGTQTPADSQAAVDQTAASAAAGQLAASQTTPQA
jgi:hypothetical protein